MAAEHRSYHHGDLAKTLVEAAIAHVSREGPENLSLRALAREAGVSQTAPYRHFNSKTCLLAAVAQSGFVELKAAMQKCADCESDIPKAIVDVGEAYVRWAVDNPRRYQLFFDSTLVDFSSYQELQKCGEECFQVILGLIRQGVDSGLFIDRPIVELGSVMWSQVHGIASLLISKTHQLPPQNISIVMDALSVLKDDPRIGLEYGLRSISNC